jgi:hypothetical protein
MLLQHEAVVTYSKLCGIYGKRPSRLRLFAFPSLTALPGSSFLQEPNSYKRPHK